MSIEKRCHETSTRPRANVVQNYGLLFGRNDDEAVPWNPDSGFSSLSVVSKPKPETRKPI